MKSTGVIYFLILAALVHCGHSASNNDKTEDFLEAISADNEVNTEILEEILSGIGSTAHFCDDPYAAVCGSEAKNRTRPAHLKQAYPDIRNHLISVLEQPIGTSEVSALSVEKILFSRCMNLGLKTDNINQWETSQFVQGIFNKEFDVSRKWQKIDNMLNRRGFDYNFFDVGVERDPENPKQRIIILKPPSDSRINELINLIDLVKTRPMSKGLAWRFFDNVDLKAVEKFFRDLAEVFKQSSTQRKQEKMTLNKWNAEYKKTSKGLLTSEINWIKLIKQSFARVDINVTGSDSIIVRNKNYLLALPDLLDNAGNYVTAQAIQVKLLLENVRYIDHQYAEALRHRKRSLFCYSETKLYGASFRLLRDLKKDDSNNALHYEVLDTMLRNIADVVQSAIDESKELSPKEKTYLRTEVKLITGDGIKHQKFKRILEEYYGNFKFEDSYFVSILKYRKMLKEKELRTLAHGTKLLTDSEPFSVIDLAKPRNRFILNVFANSFLLSKMPIPSSSQKEIHYGIYGVEIASFLYGLLNEDKFDTAVNLTGRVDWFDHPNYPAKALRCFVGDDLSSYGWGVATETVTEIFGAHIAYKAMLKDYAESGAKRPQSQLPLKSDQIFFMAYGKYHCELGQKALKTVLLNLEEYDSAFECALSHGDFQPKCPLNGFQVQKKNHFVNIPL